MAAVSDLGNGLGFVYVTKPDGTTIRQSLPNTGENSRVIKALGVEAASIALNRRPIGSFTFTVAPTGNGQVSNVTIDGTNQMLNAVSYTALTTVTGLATSVAAEINSFFSGKTTNYTALAIGATVYVLGDEAVGASDNGQPITVTVTTNPPTFTTVDVNGGSNATDVFDSVNGFRFFLNANYDANGCSCSDNVATPGTLTNAIEITNYVINRGLQSALDRQSVSISGGVISYTRKSAITRLKVDTEASAATDNLDYITPVEGVANGDILIISGVSQARDTTITSSGNIVTNGAFTTNDLEVKIGLEYEDGFWYETFRSGFGAAPVATMRGSGYPVLSSAAYASTTLTAADNTTVTLTANSSTKYQIVTGSPSLTTGNYTIALSTTGAIAGDEFYIEYNATVTVGSFAVIIGGITLSANEALLGGIFIKAYYDGSTWRYSVYYDYNGGYRIETDDIKNDAVTVEKVEADLKVEQVSRRASFETSEVGDMKTKMYYPGTISEVYFVVDKAIAATDDGTITVKNNLGSTMATLTITASTAIGTAVTATPTTNNTFVAGDIITATTAKTTKGGFGTLQYKITRS